MMPLLSRIIWIFVASALSFAFDTDTQAHAFIAVKDEPMFRTQRLSTRFLSKEEYRLDRGFRVLEMASKIVPQGLLVRNVRLGWRFLWGRMMAELAPQDSNGAYRRPTYTFTSRIGFDPSFPDEPGRYCLYVGNPCPWCQRCLLAINLLGFSADQIGVIRLEDNPSKASRGGWVFSESHPDPFGSKDLRELYDRMKPGYRGRCTAPLLVDKKTRRIVSNESADIIRSLNQLTLGDLTGAVNRIQLYPAHLAETIDSTNEWVYDLLNNGVYKCGFATTQDAYDKASAGVREGLIRCESILTESRFLCGDAFTEADLRLLPTMLRFDGAYVPLFRAGGAHLSVRCDYPAIHAWLRRCWAMPGVKESIDLEDATGSYFRNLFPLNPGGIIPSPATTKALGLDD